MGIAERKEREKQEMRDLIVQEATTMFIEEGYEKASIRHIAEKIEYSPATIYLYFKDKDELFLEIHQKAFGLLLNEMKKSEVITDPFLRIMAINRSYMEFALKNPEYYDLMFIMRGPVKKMIEECQDWDCGNDCFQYFHQIVSQAIDEGYLKPMDKFVATVSIWSTAHGLVSLHVRERFKIMHMPDETVYQLIYASMENLMHLMKI